MFGKVIVLAGGNSPEREISLKSGKQALKALKQQNIDATLADVKNKIDLINTLLQQKPDRALILLHGGCGENGKVQALLELMQIPYTGSGMLASAIAMNKYLTKKLWHAHGIATPAYVKITSFNKDKILKATQTLKLPLIVKPISSGSSIATFKVNDIEDVNLAVEKALEYGDVLLEQWIEGREFSVGILGNKILPIVEINTDSDFFDHESKYHLDTTLYTCPAISLSESKEKVLKKLAEDIFQIIEIKDFARIDLIQDLKGDFWFLEVNTVPGLFETSLISRMAAAAGISFEQLLYKVLHTTLKDVSVM